VEAHNGSEIEMQAIGNHEEHKQAGIVQIGCVECQGGKRLHAEAITKTKDFAALGGNIYESEEGRNAPKFLAFDAHRKGADYDIITTALADLKGQWQHWGDVMLFVKDGVSDDQTVAILQDLISRIKQDGLQHIYQDAACRIEDNIIVALSPSDDPDDDFPF
jgi:hypothetical protein